MTDWKRRLSRLVSNAEDHFDELATRLLHRLGGETRIKIVPYLGYGTPSRLRLRGRVLEDFSLNVNVDKDTTWRNLVNMYRRLNTKEVKNASVRATFAGQVYEVRTDGEGYFDFAIDLDPPLAAPAFWQDLPLELTETASDGALGGLPPPGELPQTFRATGRVMIPPSEAQFGVISDLDDTVIQTDVLHTLKMAQNTFLRNARTRLPFAGVGEFYQALHRGTGSLNPLFYVSNSIWNLYDLFIDFFELRGIPLGAFFLLDLGLNEQYFASLRSGKNKIAAIETLLTTYAHLPFILIGDSGEKDPDIYLQTVQRFPGRVVAVYIRDVAGSARDREIETVIAQARAVGTEMLLVPDTVAAAEHAAARGFISPGALPAIRAGMLEDNRPYSSTDAVNIGLE
jgi:phosphatidate phosphatase APP1